MNVPESIKRCLHELRNAAERRRVVEEGSREIR
jgi:hypothetical protein